MTSKLEEPTSAKDATARPKSRKKLVMILVVVLLLGGGGFWVTRPAGEAAPKAGEVEALEPILLNLAGGRYLKVGLALQLVEGVKEIDGSKALDAMIERFSGLPVAQVNNPKERKKLQEALTEEIIELYEDEVMGTYYVLFVTQ